MSIPTVFTWRHDPYAPSCMVPLDLLTPSTTSPAPIGFQQTLSEFENLEAEPKKIDVQLFKVKPCRAHPLGQCIYGARCIYAHSQAEMRTRDVNAQLMRKIVSKDNDCKVDPNKFKVRLCAKWEQYGECPYVERCMFAHGPKEMRTIAYNREVARRMSQLMADAPVV